MSAGSTSPEPPTMLLGRAETAYRRAIADPIAAGPLAEAVVAEARLAGDAEALVIGLRAQAWSARTLLAETDAKRLLDEAARVARRAGLAHRLGEVLVSRAAVQQELGRARAAEQDLERARELLGGTASADLDHLTATVHQNAGRLRAAADLYRRVLSDGSASVAVRARAGNNLGLIEAQLGRYGAARTLLQQAAGLAEQVGPAYSAYVAESQAWVAAQSGRLMESLELFEEAERRYRLAGLPLAELHADQADAMIDLRLLPEAADAARRAATEFADGKASLMSAEAELRVARLALLVDDPATAAADAARAERSLRRQRRGGWAADAVVIGTQAQLAAGTVSSADLARIRRSADALERLQLGPAAIGAHLTAARAALSQDRPAWALESLDRAHELARGAPILVRLKGRLAAATAADLRGEHQRSLHHSRAGLRDLDRHRMALASTELRVRASGHGAELGEVGLRALLRTGRPGDVLAWMERTRAAALLAVQRTAVDGIEEELAALREVQHEVDVHELDTGPEATLARSSRQAAIEERVRRMTWRRAVDSQAVSRPSPVAEIRQRLDGRPLVEYGVLDGAVFAAVLRSRRTTIADLGPVEPIRQHLDGLALVTRLLTRRATGEAGRGLFVVAAGRLAALRSLLVAPLGLAPDSELVIVPTGVLQRAPWAALHGGPVTVAPSASFWARAAGTPRPRPGGVVLVAGPDLPGAEAEVGELAHLHRAATVLRPPHSRVVDVAESLRGVDLVHLACHGHVRSDNPMFSGLVLSDGFLTVSELELRDLAPYRIVLAACEAAADVSYPGGEMLGFVSALLARGTAGVVGSVVPVPDTAAVAFMAALHRGVRRGEPLTIALHHARAELDRDDPRDFVNWCGFTAFGAA